MKKHLFVGFIAFGFSMLWWAPSSQGLRQTHGDGLLSLYNTHLNETVIVQYRKPSGSYDRHALDSIDRALRCRLTNHIHEIEPELVELVDEIQDHFGGQTVQVVSGYRSPSLNETLRRQGRKVAKHSLHMSGMAMDIRFPGVSTKKLRDYATSLKRGGVGYYPRNGFVHVDVGRVRYW